MEGWGEEVGCGCEEGIEELEVVAMVEETVFLPIRKLPIEANSPYLVLLHSTCV